MKMNQKSPHARMARLLMEHRTELYAFLRACLRNHHDAEDLLQLVSMAVMEAADQGVEPVAFVPWAREIALRRVLAHRRAAARVRPLDPELVCRLAEASGRVEQARPTTVLSEAMAACLGRLPGETREVLERRYATAAPDFDGIASEVGRSVQGVYALIKRAKVLLRECVEQRLAAETQQ